MRYYFYVDGQGRQNGPCGLEELKGKGICSTTLVWFEGLAEWTPAAQIDELKGWFPPVPDEIREIPSVPPVCVEASSEDGEQKPWPPTKTGLPLPGVEPNTPPAKPDSWLVGAILTTLLCCTPLGIAAIIFSTKGTGHWDRGEYEQAVKAFDTAKTLTLISVGLGVVLSVVYFVLVVASNGF